MIEIVVHPALTRPVVLPTSIDGPPTREQLRHWRGMLQRGEITLRGMGEPADAHAEGLRWIDAQLDHLSPDPEAR